jgi:hypothetical protein
MCVARGGIAGQRTHDAPPERARRIGLRRLGQFPRPLPSPGAIGASSGQSRDVQHEATLGSGCASGQRKRDENVISQRDEATTQTCGPSSARCR